MFAGGLGLLGGGILREVGGVFVDVCGEEVFHCCGVEHDGCLVRRSRREWLMSLRVRDWGLLGDKG